MSGAPAVPIPPGSATDRGVTRVSCLAAWPAVMPPYLADRTASQPFPVRNLPRPTRSLRLYGDGHVDGPAGHVPCPHDPRAPPATGPDVSSTSCASSTRSLRLATTARTWDELLETVVDGTRDALHADVSSLYLVDRDGAYLTLAATNGLDRYQIGRARVPFGEGVTGRVAATQQPLVIPDVKADPRFLWVRGIDQRRFVASMLSVPLSWHDQTVGVLNVQTERPRDFGPADVNSWARSRTCSRASSRRAASSPRPRRGSRRSRPSTRRAAS